MDVLDRLLARARSEAINPACPASARDNNSRVQGASSRVQGASSRPQGAPVDYADKLLSCLWHILAPPPWHIIRRPLAEAAGYAAKACCRSAFQYQRMSSCQTVLRQVGDATEDVGEPSLKGDVGELAGALQHSG